MRSRVAKLFDDSGFAGLGDVSAAADEGFLYLKASSESPFTRSRPLNSSGKRDTRTLDEAHHLLAARIRCGYKRLLDGRKERQRKEGCIGPQSQGQFARRGNQRHRFPSFCWAIAQGGGRARHEYARDHDDTGVWLQLKAGDVRRRRVQVLG